MTIWIVIGYDNYYYPHADNALGYFLKEEDAKDFLEKQRELGGYDCYLCYSVVAV
ncbi:MAG: hypothetical protein HRU18_06420 [Pseudoalteromonas sp.]|uniref:hypothetical protein n=1 Tax=Pseudoalteromonas sp. TaxID=53249 RepID=UPI001E193A77|nr:hypothetical protein [Pseudoalteromonas sp.]NRA77824.1 hypothetical protein [Pseudoalteromonas sp.]